MNQYQEDIAGLQPTQMTASPVLGTETRTTYQTTTQFEDFPIPARNVPVYETVLITADNVRQAIGALEEQEQKAIAYEIFLGVPGAYGGDYELIFNDDGTINILDIVAMVNYILGN